MRFKEQKIAYELSLQEAASLYTTGNPTLSSVNIVDSLFGGMGKFSFLVHGIDCPHHSIYQDAVIFVDGVTKHVKDAICIFEETPSVPLRCHHHSKGNSF